MVKYLQTAPELNGPEHEKAWLLRVAANLSKNRLAYNRVRRADDVDELSETLVGQQREDLILRLGRGEAAARQIPGRGASLLL